MMEGVEFMKKRLFRIKTPIVSFCLNYIILLLITICIGSYAYNQSLNIVKRDVIESGLSSLEQSKNLLDTRLKEVESIAVQMALDNRVLNFLNIKTPFSGPDYYKIQEISRKLPSYRLTNKFIIDAYIYFASDVLISSAFATADTRSYYESVLNYDSIDYETWVQKVSGRYYNAEYWPASKVAMINNHPTVITYLQSVPLGSYQNYKGTVMVLIDENEVLKSLGSITASESGWSYIADRSGNIITSHNISMANIPDITFEDDSKGFMEISLYSEDMIIMHTTSVKNGWRYVAALPSHILTQKVTYIKNMYIYTLIAALLVGIIIAILLAYRSSKPIRQLIKKIKKSVDGISGQTVNEYDFLEDTVSKLIQNNDELKIEMEKQLELSRANFFERLLRGGFSRLTEIETVQSYIGFNLKGRKYSAVVIRINRYNGIVSEDILNELDLIRVVINNVLKQNMRNECITYNVDNDKIAIISGFEYSDVQKVSVEMEGKITKIIDALLKDYNISISAGVGGLCESLINVCNSFEEAVQALERISINSDQRLIFFHDITKTEADYYYPMDVESRLISLVKMGEKNEVMNIVDAIYAKNFSDSLLPMHIIKQLIYEIRGTIIKLKAFIIYSNTREASNIDTMLEVFDSAETTEQVFKSAGEIFSYLCNRVNVQKKSHNVALKEKITEYIQKEYWREDLCISSIASKFNLAEKYFSIFFKEQVGESFTNYLEKMRMTRAAELLNDQNMSVKDVSKKTGYTTPNTFYKAFKRFYGVSPSTYRQDFTEEIT